MRDAILQALATIAAERQVQVLHACESGSRAWGFASPDSDWDVRFLYRHDLEWYLRVRAGKDSIERMLPGDLDVSGWELRKALGLFARSNVALFEHLGSPIQYLDGDGLLAQLRALVPSFFNPIAAGYHYLGAARTALAHERAGASFRVKKLFYVLRPLAAFRWIELHATMPPTGFAAVLDGIDLELAWRRRIDDLSAQKVVANELDPVAVGPDLIAWIDQWVARSSAAAGTLPHRGGDVAQLDGVLAQRLRG